jgi:AmiR/NasT family two-component response regulator
MVGRTEALLIPTNPEQLKSELLLALARVREAQALNKQLESSNRELEERLRVKEKKAAEGSRHGKKGLGIKKPR